MSTKHLLAYGDISVNSPSVTIPFGTHASEDLEITPCFYHSLVGTPLGKKKAYAIANGSNGWMLSSPQAHNAYVELINKRLSGKLKPLIRLVKAWKFYHQVPIHSFYLELRIAKFVERKTQIDLASDLYRIMNHLNDIALARIQDTMKVSGYIHACSTDSKKKVALSKLSTGRTRSLKACKGEGENSDSFHWWNLFYNGQFPSRLA